MALYRGTCVEPRHKATPSCWLFDCVHRVCRGFTDADGKREFLFALPRFARDEVKLCVYGDRLLFKTCLGQFSVTL